ncbi:MAG TPA: biopolymer transporter ExbD [Polyangiaceae bacterium]|nr:biopolymer transporter ExbD [Polyangiaceae bacterium]
MTTSDPTAPGAPRLPRQKPAGLATYKRELRKAIARNRVEPEINFLNITAMMDMMTIILVFLLKSLSTSTASLPQSQDLQLPKSILTTEPDSEPEGLPVIVSKSQIIVGETVVCPVPPDAAQYGTEAKYKRGSRNDYFIVPLGSALQSWRDSDKRIRMATGKDPSQSEAILIADSSTPYRLVTEVMYTLGQTEFAKFHMMVLSGGSSAKKD